MTLKRKKTTIDKIKVAFNNCYTERCFKEAIERCNFCKELFCTDHINDHEFCERIAKLRRSKAYEKIRKTGFFERKRMKTQ